MVGTMAKIDDSVKKKVPELRFKGFTDEWEVRKLGDFIDVKSGKDYKHLNSGSIPVYGTGGYMLSVDRALSDMDAIGIGRKGTIDKPYLLKAPFWTVDTLFYAVPKQNIDLQFSLSIFKKINWKKFDESTGVPSLSKTVINSVGASVPSYEEQQKIGSFFKQLDNTIALHQLKLDLLKEQKKGYLQKMFPKNGAKVPELRFAGFADDWEERKLIDIAGNISDGDWIEANHIFDTGDYRIVQTGNIGIGSFLDKLQNAKYFYQADFDELKANEIFPGDILISRLSDPAGRTSILPDLGVRAVTAVDVAIIRPNDNFHAEFLVAELNSSTILAKVDSLASGSTRKRISRKNLEGVQINLPTFEEQQKIGSFFKQLDDTIALHQRKLDLLKEQKKGFLQKMFV